MCPKCKAGSMRQMGISSSKWQCTVCGYTEYRAGGGSSVSSSISANRQRRYEASNNFDAARRNANDAIRDLGRSGRDARSRSSQKEKGGTSVLGVIVVMIILWILFNS